MHVTNFSNQVLLGSPHFGGKPSWKGKEDQWRFGCRVEKSNRCKYSMIWVSMQSLRLKSITILHYFQATLSSNFLSHIIGLEWQALSNQLNFWYLLLNVFSTVKSCPWNSFVCSCKNRKWRRCSKWWILQGRVSHTLVLLVYTFRETVELVINSNLYLFQFWTRRLLPGRNTASSALFLWERILSKSEKNQRLQSKFSILDFGLNKLLENFCFRNLSEIKNLSENAFKP